MSARILLRTCITAACAGHDALVEAVPHVGLLDGGLSIPGLHMQQKQTSMQQVSSSKCFPEYGEVIGGSGCMCQQLLPNSSIFN